MPSEVNSHQQAIIHSFEKLDWKTINDILDNRGIYMNNEKHRFIQLIRTAFASFHLSGDTVLIKNNGRCLFSEECVNSYTFIGNNSKNYVELIISPQADQKTGIQECYCHHSSETCPDAGQRVYIDPDKGSPF